MDTLKPPDSLARRVTVCAIGHARALDLLPLASVQARERVMQEAEGAIGRMLAEANNLTDPPQEPQAQTPSEQQAPSPSCSGQRSA